MLLANALDTIQEAYADNDFLSALEDAQQHGVPADLSDLHTIYQQDGLVLRDTGVLVEYFDGDEYGFGIVDSWHTNPFDLYDNETDEDFAFILRDNGGTTYANYHSLRPICEVDANDNLEHGDTLPMWTAVATSNEQDTTGQNDPRNLYQLQAVASLPVAMEVA